MPGPMPGGLPPLLLLLGLAGIWLLLQPAGRGLHQRLVFEENALLPGVAGPAPPLHNLSAWPSIPAAWLSALQARGLEGGELSDGSVFAVVRAARAPGGACLLLHAPGYAFFAVQLLAAAADALDHHADFLARDVVLLITSENASAVVPPDIGPVLAALSWNLFQPTTSHFELVIRW